MSQIVIATVVELDGRRGFIRSRETEGQEYFVAIEGEIPLGPAILTGRMTSRGTFRLASLDEAIARSIKTLEAHRASKLYRDVDIRDAYALGVSITEIADAVGLTRQHVHTILGKDASSCLNT
jgi:hypothetical protein